MARHFAGVVATVAASAIISLGGFGHAADDTPTVRDSITAPEIMSLLGEAGLSPTLLQDKATGAPVATGQTDGLIFVVRAMDCRGLPQRCGQLLLFANFELGREVTEEDYRLVNSFNESNLKGRAYVLEGKRQIGIDFVIDMTGGVTGEHIGSRLGRGPTVIEDFRTQMQEVRTGS